MTPCPIYQRPAIDAGMVYMPYVYGQTLALRLKINPDWQREDGMCRACLESIINTVAEIEDAKTQERPSATLFSEYYRYTLTKREQGQWHHCNPDMETWRQRQIVERVGDEAHKQVYDCWLAFDTDEGLLAQGVAT